MGYLPYILTISEAIMTFAGRESKNRIKRPPTKSEECLNLITTMFSSNCYYTLYYLTFKIESRKRSSVDLISVQIEPLNVTSVDKCVVQHLPSTRD